MGQGKLSMWKVSSTNKVRGGDSSRFKLYDFLGMAAIPFLFNGLLLNQFNLSRVHLVFTLKLAKVHF